MSNTRQGGEEKRPQADAAAVTDLDPGEAANNVRGGKTGLSASGTGNRESQKK